VFRGKQDGKAIAYLGIMFSEGGLDRDSYTCLIRSREAITQEVGQNRLHTQEAWYFRFRAQQSPVDGFLKHLRPTLKGQCCQDRLLLEMIHVVFEEFTITYSRKRGQAEQELLRLWREIAV